MIAFVRFGAGLVTLLMSASAYADPYLEAGGFVGVDDYSDQLRLGGSRYDEQRPQTAPVVGARLTAMVVRTRSLDLGLEPELAFTSSWTGYGFDAARGSYFAPVLGYRASAILRLRSPRAFRLHLLGGIGGATVMSSSPYVRTDSDPVVFYGVGATISLGDQWLMRLDVRQGFMPGRTDDAAITYEGLIGIGMRFGDPAPRVVAPPPPPPPVVVVAPPPPPPVVVPPPAPLDTDQDGIPDTIDKCPDVPEDRDGFADDDGCPDPDNDGDGILDAQDKCPNEGENKNGFEDEDGCKDQIPPAIVAAFEAASAVRFDGTRAKLSDAARASLARTVVQLHAHPTLRVVITSHPTGKGDAAKDAALAKKRAEVVKWYLVEQGTPADQVDVAIGAVAKAPIELALSPRPAPSPAP
jgi:outer membrane protein OmpA-like peptidoglycan-associated protein